MSERKIVLEMSEAEIVKRYNQRPSKEKINVLAQLNDCSPERIIQILKKNNIEIPEKKGGRPPKKKKASEQNIPSIEEPKKDEFSDLQSKVESVPEFLSHEEHAEMHGLPVPKYLIPKAVQEMTKEKIESLQRQIIFMCEKIDELNAEKHELEVFLKGDWVNDGKENKLLR